MSAWVRTLVIDEAEREANVNLLGFLTDFPSGPYVYSWLGSCHTTTPFWNMSEYLGELAPRGIRPRGVNRRQAKTM